MATKGNGWIKLYRSMLDWEWYSDPVVCRVFLHLLLIANIEDQRKHGVVIPTGSIDRTQQQLADELHLSRKQIRRALGALTETNEVAITKQGKFSVISIVSWHSYQVEGPRKGHDKGQARAKEGPKKGHLNKNIEEREEYKKYIQPDGSFNPHPEIREEDYEE